MDAVQKIRAELLKSVYVMFPICMTTVVIIPFPSPFDCLR